MIYLNGAFMPIEEARIPVLDRGFIFGDGVYEVIPVYSRRPFRLPEHLLRLQHSLDGIRPKIRIQTTTGAGCWNKLLPAMIAMTSISIYMSRAGLPDVTTHSQ